VVTKKQNKKSAAKKKSLAKKKAETQLTQLKTKTKVEEEEEIATQTDVQETPKPASIPAPKPEATKKEAAPKKVLDPLDTVEPDPVFKNKEEKIAHEDKVRNEGLKLLMFKPKGNMAQQETELEIEEPGAANSVAEEGAKTIQSQAEFEQLKE